MNPTALVFALAAEPHQTTHHLAQRLNTTPEALTPLLNTLTTINAAHPTDGWTLDLPPAEALSRYITHTAGSAQ